MGDDAHAKKCGVRDDIRGGGCRVAGNVHLRINESLGEAAKDTDEEVEDAGDPRDALWRRRECFLPSRLWHREAAGHDGASDDCHMTFFLIAMSDLRVEVRCEEFAVCSESE